MLRGTTSSVAIATSSTFPRALVNFQTQSTAQKLKLPAIATGKEDDQQISGGSLANLVYRKADLVIRNVFLNPAKNICIVVLLAQMNDQHFWSWR
ncbi:hypothetical protein EVAR_90958_1 [Eumeta japonica]|uniref:Uncharacterized protein n=1 Tax=Eumeta variegata TaxID=151549 RepID=A0A4C1Z8P1_EUMVA|nr:hypothetical protein EVAR_90958_1 [Eumeta japonica]